MTKFLSDVELLIAAAKVFDKDGKLLYQGGDACEWIMQNAVHPHTIQVEGVEGAFSIDEYMQEVEKQDEEYHEDFPNHGEVKYYRDQIEKNENRDPLQG